MSFVRLNTVLTNNDGAWTFIGEPRWKEDFGGVIYPPTWSLPDFDQDPSRVPYLYAHELAREDSAIITAQPLADTDISVDYKCPYGLIRGGIVFRAVDSARCYVLDLLRMGRKGQSYELILWVQDATGYRREIARGIARHSVVPENLVQSCPLTRAEWNRSSPEWVTVRVQASGTFIRVSLDGRIVFEVRDRTYLVGCAGLVVRGSALFRRLRVEGEPAALPAPWAAQQEELPRFFYPGGEQPEGFNAGPRACRTPEGAILVAWIHQPQFTNPEAPCAVVLTRSDDEGRTWSVPRAIFQRDGWEVGPGSLFAHQDGSISCLIGAVKVGAAEVGAAVTLRIASGDGGASWSGPEEFLVGGQALSPFVNLYSPMTRLSTGMVVMCGYEAKVVPGGDAGHNADLLDRSLFFRSLDDGHTWEEPIQFDPNNFDQNECMVAEGEPGHLVAFMRTLRAPYMWTTASEDGGVTWAPLTQSTITAECPFLLRHSSGALIMGSRSEGTYLNLSFDQGRTWSARHRMMAGGAMMAMVEMADGRVLNVMHEGYRVPGHIRGQFFRVTPAGPVAAE